MTNTATSSADWISNSGLNNYLRLCTAAVDNDSVFTRFKTNPLFVALVGDDSANHAATSYKTVISKDAEVTANLDKFILLESVCKPYRTIQLDNKAIGLDTVRFLETVTLIKKYIGSLAGKTLTEFGSNYGGLAGCLLIQNPNIHSYQLIDYPEVTALSLKYLENHPTLTTTISNIPPYLFVSEYALTELSSLALYRSWLNYAVDAEWVYLRINFHESALEAHFLNVIGNTHQIVANIREPLDRQPNRIIIAHRITHTV